jgi:hypothetical protein
MISIIRNKQTNKDSRINPTSTPMLQHPNGAWCEWGNAKTCRRAAVEGDENIHLKFLLMGFNGRTLLIRVKQTVAEIVIEEC